MDYTQMSASVLCENARKGTVSAADICSCFSENISLRGEKLFTELPCKNSEQADKFAEKPYQQQLLAGLPYAVSDVIATKHLPTECGSAMLKGYYSPFEAASVEALNNAGALLMGKLCVDEFGIVSETASVMHPATVPHLNCGAEAVRQGIIPVAIDCDTGLFRETVLCSGVPAFKPGMGALTRRGLLSMQPLFEQISVIARNIEDIALVYTALSGFAAGAIKCAPTMKHLPAANCGVSRLGLIRPPQGAGNGTHSGGCKYAAPSKYFAKNEQSVFMCRLMEFLCGALSTEYIDIPELEFADSAYKVLSAVQFASCLMKMHGILSGGPVVDTADTLDALYKKMRSAGFGIAVKQQIMLGAYFLENNADRPYLQMAIKAQSALRDRTDAVFANNDIIIAPLYHNPSTISSVSPTASAQGIVADSFTHAINMAGLCAVVLPVHSKDDNSLAGIQLASPDGKETELLEAASHIESYINNVGAAVKTW